MDERGTTDCPQPSLMLGGDCHGLGLHFSLKMTEIVLDHLDRYGIKASNQTRALNVREEAWGTRPEEYFKEITRKFRVY